MALPIQVVVLPLQVVEIPLQVMEIPLQVAVALLAITLLVDGKFVNVGLAVNPCV